MLTKQDDRSLRVDFPEIYHSVAQEHRVLELFCAFHCTIQRQYSSKMSIFSLSGEIFSFAMLVYEVSRYYDEIPFFEGMCWAANLQQDKITIEVAQKS